MGMDHGMLKCFGLGGTLSSPHSLKGRDPFHGQGDGMRGFPRRVPDGGSFL